MLTYYIPIHVFIYSVKQLLSTNILEYVFVLVGRLVGSSLYNCVSNNLIYINDQIYVANYLLYIIILHRFEVFVSGSILRSKTIEPAVQLVLNGWTNEPTGPPVRSSPVLITMTKTKRSRDADFSERSI